MRTKLFPYLLIFLMLGLGYSCKKDHNTEPQTPFLNISRTDIEVGSYVGYIDTVVVQSNVDWTINVAAGASTWLSVAPVKKTGDSTVITIKVTAASTSSSQTATLTIMPASSNVQSRQINISRRAAYNLVWQKCYGGGGDDKCFSTALLPNGQFVTTGFSIGSDGDVLGNVRSITGWVLKAGSDANKIWQKQIGNFSSSYQSIVASPDGGTVSVGYVFATNGYADLSVVKFDANGNVVWNKTYGGSGSEYPYKIINTTDGGYLVTGDSFSKDGDVKATQGNFDSWVVKLDANGNLIWGKTYGGAGEEAYTTATACPDGGYVLLVTTPSNNSGDVPASHGGQDLLVIKIDANGNKVWTKIFGGSSSETSANIISDTDGGSIVVGYTASTNGDLAERSVNGYDLWVLKLTKDGEIGWQTTLGGSGAEKGCSIDRLPNGNLVIGSTTDSKDGGITGNHGYTDIWVVVLNNRGKMLWQKTFGSSGIDENTGINAAADGSVLVTNIVTRNDGDVSGSHGSEDSWIFKLQ